MPRRLLHTLGLPAATLSALTRAGYETVQDIAVSTPEQLAKDARIPLHASQAVYTATQTQKAPPLTQSAATLFKRGAEKYRTGCCPVDDVLGGGLQPGSVLEISGPPGTAKEALAVEFARAFIEEGRGVLFIDMQNMTTATQLFERLQLSSVPQSELTTLVLHQTLLTLTDFMIFIQKLPAYLEEHTQVHLLVLNSLWFPFQSTADISYYTRNALLEKTKYALAQACASTSISVVITTQLSTKLINADGTPASFDTGARAVMLPQPAHTYLPPGRSYRLMIVPRTRTTGVVRLISSPSHPYEPNQAPHREELYEMVGGIMREYDQDGSAPA